MLGPQLWCLATVTPYGNWKLVGLEALCQVALDGFWQSLSCGSLMEFSGHGSLPAALGGVLKDGAFDNGSHTSRLDFP